MLTCWLMPQVKAILSPSERVQTLRCFDNCEEELAERAVRVWIILPPPKLKTVRALSASRPHPPQRAPMIVLARPAIGWLTDSPILLLLLCGSCLSPSLEHLSYPPSSPAPASGRQRHASCRDSVISNAAGDASAAAAALPSFLPRTSRPGHPTAV